MYQPSEKEFSMKRIVAAIACHLMAGTAVSECKTVYINGIANTVCDSNPPVAAPVIPGGTTRQSGYSPPPPVVIPGAPPRQSGYTPPN